MMLPMAANADQSGECGENLTWTFIEATNTLTISGSGDMKNYYDSSPWNKYKSKIEKVIIKNGVTSIGERAFKVCTSLTSVTIGNSVTSIGNYAFSGCSGLTSVDIPNSVTSIGISAFEGCSGLTSVDIPNSVTSIGGGAFEKCSGLTSVTIGNSVTSIGRNAFYGCSGLISVDIPNSVTSIGISAFEGCSGLTSITIPNSVASLGGGAFYKCSGLTSVTIGNSVTSIGTSTFYECTSLTSVIIPNSVTSIGIYAFSGCNLYSLVIGTGVLSIREEQSKPRKTIWLTNTPPEGYNNLVGNMNYVANDSYSFDNNYEKKVYPFLSSIFDVDGVEYVPVSPSDRTCDAINNTYDENITSVSIGPTVNYRGIEMTVNKLLPYALSGNHFIKKVELWKDIELIDVGEFDGCTSLEGINIPCAVKEIRNYAFDDCNSLKNVVIEDREDVLTLGYGYNNNKNSSLFAACPLETVYIGGKIAYNKSSSYGYSPFYRNTTLRSVTITDRETEIYENEFYGCTNLKNVKIGDGVTTIGDYAFSGCASLNYFAFGSSVRDIGQEAFSDCTAMTKLISRAQEPPQCGTQALDDINKWECTLIVPQGRVDAYRAAEQWKEFFFIEEGDGIPTGIEDNNRETITNNQYPITNKRYFDLQGRQQNDMRKGVNIVRMGDGTTRKVIRK